ncbi:MAG: transcriptional repressor LexA [Dehalococcoidia bacterium]|nr:transcriptional repressor LexA [Dehalococcoidia bacterium]
MRPVSAKQEKIFTYLKQFAAEKGYPPSIREIGKACGISSTSVVKYNLNILQREGYIRRDPEVSRGIDLASTSLGDRIIHIPMLGVIAAGEPIPVPSDESWSQAQTAEVVEVSPELLHGKENVFALRVKGTSMIDALIDDGDLVLMETTRSADDGEMVAVWLKAQGETTLKRIYREGARVRLQPANSQMKPIYADARDVEVQGRVVGVIRGI